MKKIIILFLLAFQLATAQETHFTELDTIYGAYTPERAWWDLNYYHLDVEVDPKEKSLDGSVLIQYTVLETHDVMQIELQKPLEIERIMQQGAELDYSVKGFSYFIHLTEEQKPGEVNELKVYYSGVPHESTNPPWSGGITWSKDENGNPFVASSCQGDGPSIWWPCKDHPKDEVDSVLISVTVPEDLMDVSNGRLRGIDENTDGTRTFHWFVGSPINHYGININVGDYVHFDEVYNGEKGELDCDYYVLRDNLEKAKVQFQQVPKMLDAFEHWFGPYPFYEDGFKLVEAPYLGMEHQSSVTYGNGYENGYRGSDLSGSGWGLKFDYIIIHEAGHEWFANNITYADVADMWIHESFTTYSENLYLDYHFGKEASSEYVLGMRSSIVNDGPIIGKYGVDQEGSRDMYFKGANILHTLRQIVNDDEKWREVLRGLNKEFYHQTVTTQEVEAFINDQIKVDLTSFFDQYLRDYRIPIFSYRIHDGNLMYKYDNVVPGFGMPIRLIQGEDEIWLDDASTRWQSIPLEGEFEVDPNFYVASFNLTGD
ncbi:M1 family metallopeptidase [Membranihabitans maritimus]|uniref:M1 family metallopeptidase n=1 Tax=Membranihabitans maritimus TaxID=2904244 RepID=UPI001F29A35A|nr:M1 family metallopeptidase [Membranihabitans maritimus]